MTASQSNKSDAPVEAPVETPDNPNEEWIVYRSGTTTDDNGNANPVYDRITVKEYRLKGLG